MIEDPVVNPSLPIADDDGKSVADGLSFKGIADLSRRQWELLKDDKMLMMVPFSWMTGAVLAFYASFMQVIVRESLSSEASPMEIT